MSQPTIADRVRSALVLHRVTQQQAGAELGMNQRAVSRRLNGEVEFSATELQKLAGLLGVPVSFFYGEVAS
jgi:transcriptional regulator with XRE-family HTH domain